MNAPLDRLVKSRANDRCEYCLLPQSISPIPHQIDHIIARKHHGPTIEGNLALACFFCNSHKGPNIAGIDPRSGRMTRLFHPRTDHWSLCFRWRGLNLMGRNRVGRSTVDVLEINDPDFVVWRGLLLQEGRFPFQP